MTEIDISSLTLEDLKSLRTKINRAIDTFEDRRKKEALAAADAKAREYGFSISELMDSGKKGNPPPRPAKYRHPENPELTWTGRGRQPQWYKDAVEGGADPSDMLISA